MSARDVLHSHTTFQGQLAKTERTEVKKLVTENTDSWGVTDNYGQNADRCEVADKDLTDYSRLPNGLVFYVCFF